MSEPPNDELHLWWEITTPIASQDAQARVAIVAYRIADGFEWGDLQLSFNQVTGGIAELTAQRIITRDLTS